MTRAAALALGTRMSVFTSTRIHQVVSFLEGKNKMKPTNLTRMIRNLGIKVMREEEGSLKCGVESGKCGVLIVERKVWSVECKV